MLQATWRITMVTLVASLLVPGKESTTNMNKKSFLYFAYGSNLLKERLQLENPSARVHCVARLQDYKLVFGNHQGHPSDRWHGGVATIEHSPGDEVWGVVWEMNLDDLESLDRQENVKLGAYSPVEVSVRTGGQELTCRTYIMNSCVYAPPSPQYLKVIVMGAEQNGLPEEYQQKLRAIQTNKYEGPLLVMQDLEKAIQKSKEEANHLLQQRTEQMQTTESTFNTTSVTAVSNVTNNHFLYFAYGSNLLKERLQLRNPSACFHTIGILKGYALKFGFWGKGFERLNIWHGGVATIEEKKDSEVWGVIWKIGNEHLRTLDKQEGVDIGFYQPLEVKVEIKDGELLCRTYQMNNFTAQLTSPQYKQVMCLGAKQNGLPLDYTNKICAVETNDYSGPSVLDDINAVMEDEKHRTPHRCTARTT
ncbi:gamma-glutamylcyclotransferase isoform X1 [Scleropages formosus]|uniref:Gamma-glutamylcyclotransferase b n=1 Tax=Scleropages formosus TaxID=113540 RepID=A0A8C9SED4_SCLFO|nr:uncharacterized protein LOC108935796 isoform X1 [Scleropages formosus]